MFFGQISNENDNKKHLNLSNSDERYEFLNIIDAVFEVKEENVDEVFNLVETSGISPNYITKCLETALKIRQANLEGIISLLTKISKKFNYYPSLNLTYFYKKLLSKRGLTTIVKRSERNSFFEIESPNLYEDEMVKIIMKDDIDKFVKILEIPDFNFNKTFSVGNDNPFYIGEDNNRSISVSYSQIIVLLGAVKCFKYAFMNGLISENKLNQYAIAGGNNEIIRILEQNEERYDKCYKAAIKYHRNNISKWLLNNYKCEEVYTKETLQFFNNREFFERIENGTEENQLAELFYIVSGQGCLEIVKFFVETLRVDPNRKVGGKTALHSACSEASFSVAKYLIEECSLDPNELTYHNENALISASESENLELIKYLVEECNVDINSMDTQFNTAFFNASYDLTEKIMKYLLEECDADVNGKYDHDSMKGYGIPLIFAANAENMSLVKYLTQRFHAKIDKAIPYASFTNNGGLIKYLVKDCGGNIDELTDDFHHMPSLHIACRDENYEFAKFLIKECNASVGLFPNRYDGDASVLKYVTHNLDFIKFLLNEGKIDTSLIDENILKGAIKADDLDLVKKLVEDCHMPIEYDKLSSIGYKVQGYLNKVLSLLNESSEGNIKNVCIFTNFWHISPNIVINGTTALNQAAISGMLNVVEFLVANAKADVNIKDKNGNTPLLNAVLNENESVAKYLMQFTKNLNPICETLIETRSVTFFRDAISRKKFDPEEKDVYGRTPLMCACIQGNIPIIMLLVETYHVDIEATDDGKNTCLHYAATYGSLNAVRFLVKNCNMDITKENCNYETAFDLAVKNSCSSIVIFFIEECHQNIKNEYYEELADLTKFFDKRVLLHKMCREEDISGVKSLVLAQHADVDQKFNGITPLHIACSIGNLELVKFLVEVCHANVNERDNKGMTPLHIVVCRHCLSNITNTIKSCIPSDKEEDFSYLIKQIKSQFESENPDEKSFKQYKENENNLMDIIKILVESGHADVDVKDKGNKTAAYYAVLGFDFDVVKFLFGDHNACIEYKVKVKYDEEEKIKNMSLLHKATFNSVYNEFNERYLAEIYSPYYEDDYKDILELIRAKILKVNFEIVKFLIEVCHADYESESHQKTVLHMACENGNFELAKYLIENLGLDTKVKDSKMASVLHYACDGTSIELVKYLINNYHIGINDKMNNYKNNTPLHRAITIKHEDIITYLIEEQHSDICDFDILIAPHLRKYALLNEACLKEDFETVKNLIENEHMYPDQMINKRTPLHNACIKGNLEISQYLINNYHVDVEAKDQEGRTPLHYAVNSGNLELIKFLIEKCSVDIEAKDSLERTALSIACRRDDFEIIKYLVEECHANFSSKDIFGRNCVLNLCRKGLINIVKYLVENFFANIATKDNKGYSALHVACQRNDIELAKYLFEKCRVRVNVTDYKGRTPLHFAVANNSIELVKYLVEKCHADIEIKAEDYDKNTALRIASENCNLQIIKYLIDERHASKATLSKNAIIKACEKEDFDLLRYLLEVCHVNVEEKDDNGRTAFIIACEKGNELFVKYLANFNKANIEARDIRGRTSLSIACLNGKLQIVEYLIKKLNADPNVEDFNKETPFFIACKNKHIQIARFLLNNCGSKKCVDLDTLNRLMKFANNKNDENLARFLLEECHIPFNDKSSRFININNLKEIHDACKEDLEKVKKLVEEKNCYADQKYNGKAPLIIALDEEKYDIAKYLIEKCSVDIETRDDFNFERTPLFVAIWNGNLDFVKYLVEERSANVHQRDAEGIEPLSIALYKNHKDIFLYLVEKCGANLKSRNNKGDTILHLAISSKNSEYIDYLIKRCPELIQMENNLGHTPLDYAILYEDNKHVESFIRDYGSSIKGREQGLLENIMCDDNARFLKYLVEERGLDPNFKLYGNLPFVICAVRLGPLNVVKYIIGEHKANLIYSIDVLIHLAKSEEVKKYLKTVKFSQRK